MKPIGILRFSSTEGPGYFATVLERNSLAWEVIKLDAGEVVPTDASAFGGLVFMGGPMSVNDPLPWVSPVLDLIRDAVHKDVPTLGHCLGGQLMSKALGGVVGRNPQKEIGWGKIAVLPTPVAQRWFSHVAPAFESFHWHGETFSIPPGAERVLANQYCDNQAFALGKHLGMQCHIEMTPEMIDIWCETGGREIARSSGPGVQSVDAIKTDMPARVDALHHVADGVYREWMKGLSS